MNILYIHSHDTGRCIGPYGFPVNTPAFNKLASEGVMFKQAFAVASSCSASRASLQTGQYPHQNGMTGLAHRGWKLNNYDHHLVNYLRKQENYHSVLIGEHHVAPQSEMIGYDEILTDASSRKDIIAGAAEKWLANPLTNNPWFMSVGFWETHRTSFQEVNSMYSKNAASPSVKIKKENWPFVNLPCNDVISNDVRMLQQSVTQLDDGIGRVLAALDKSGQKDNTLIICTTDHAPGFPGWKANVTDRGLGVFMFIVGPSIVKNRISNQIVSHLDLFPTICDYVRINKPDWLEGKSLVPVLNGNDEEIHEELFSEANFHAAYEPQRSIRTSRFRYTKRFDERGEQLVLPNIDDGNSKSWVLENNPNLLIRDEVYLFDLENDPNELINLAGNPDYLIVMQNLDLRLTNWMKEVGDPLIQGIINKPKEALSNNPDSYSAAKDKLESATQWGENKK